MSMDFTGKPVESETKPRLILLAERVAARKGKREMLATLESEWNEFLDADSEMDIQMFLDRHRAELDKQEMEDGAE